MPLNPAPAKPIPYPNNTKGRYDVRSEMSLNLQLRLKTCLLEVM